MNPTDPDAVLKVVHRQRVKRELLCKEREKIVSCLLWKRQNHDTDGKFPRGTLTVVGNHVGACNKKIRRVWARALENFQDPSVHKFCAQSVKSVCHHKWDKQVRDTNDSNS